MTSIFIATRNEKKKRELKTLLKDFDGINIVSINDIKVNLPVVVEDGKTFRQNAVKKAVIFSKFIDSLVLADDSGLEVDALQGKPGVRSARFARGSATDKENNEKLLKLMEKVPEKNRQARFVCNIALARKGSFLENFEGTVKGKIIFKKRGMNGFGYDPFFVPDGYDKTFAEMPASLKNDISHRGIALKKLKKALRKYL